MRLRPVLLLIPAMSLLAACSTTAGGSPSGTGESASAPSASGSAALDGHTFVATSVKGHDLPQAVTITLTFKDGTVSVHAGCNTMNGSYSVENGTLTVGTMASTQMACPEPLMALDTWLTTFLPGASISVSGDTLTLAKAGVTMTLVDQQSLNLPLEGTVWTVDGLVGNSAVSSVPQGVRASLVFHGGRVDVNTGCNTGSGSAAITGATITFGPLATTRMACPADAMSVEQHVAKVLTGTQPYSIAGDALKIGGNGKEGLTLNGTTPPAPTPSLNAGPS
jgi:heat shock protein HslJ